MRKTNLISDPMNFPEHIKQFGLTADTLLVWAFIPFREDGFFGDSYDWQTTQKELNAAFQQLGINWRWQPVTLNELPGAVQKVRSDTSGKFSLVLNYCDGDEKNGFPGLSVVHALESAGIAYSGADAFFYEISSSKTGMKRMFEKSGTPTAPFEVLDDVETKALGLCARLGTPLIVKPSTAAASWGLTPASVVETDEAIMEQYRRLKQGMHGQDFSESEVYVERFVSGPEYTVFLTGSHTFPESRHVYPPMERVINPRLPVLERFLSHDRYWQKKEEGSPLPPGEKFYVNRLARPDTWNMLQTLAWEAHCAVQGKGYSRVDIRIDENTGQPFVLEVNANCSLSSPEDDTSVGNILHQTGLPFSGVIAEILTDALQRHFLHSSLP